MDNNSAQNTDPKKAENIPQQTAQQETVTSSKHSNKVLFIILGVIGIFVISGILITIFGVVLGKKAIDNAAVSIKTENGETTTYKTDKNGNVTAETKDKTTGTESSTSTEQKLPDDFPSNIPLYSNQKIIYSSKNKDADESSWKITTESSDSVSKVLEGLKTKFKAWSLISESETNGSYYLNYEKDGYKVDLAIEKSDKTDIPSSIFYSVTKSNNSTQ